MTAPIRQPRYGMVVTEGTGIWMLIVPQSPESFFESGLLVWYALSLSSGRRGVRDYVLIDPAVYGEVA